ncbi:MAG: RibD family protein [Myxococcales bacterium]|nr:RibD family protein [Myxococcales bacterium]
MSAADQVLLKRYLPFLKPHDLQRPVVLAHLAQSLDGRIALPHGESQWISGSEDLEHTHCLRALADAVVVGALTVQRDDPQLTVRHVAGPSPLRVVLDPNLRLDGTQRIFSDESAPTLWVKGSVAGSGEEEPHVKVIGLPCTEGLMHPATLLDALAERGVKRVLVEGGGVTVSRFLQAGCVDRLHLVVAPLLMGEGRPALSLPLAETLARCPRPATRVEPLGNDWLFDCDLTST